MSSSFIASSLLNSKREQSLKSYLTLNIVFINCPSTQSTTAISWLSRIAQIKSSISVRPDTLFKTFNNLLSCTPFNVVQQCAFSLQPRAHTEYLAAFLDQGLYKCSLDLATEMIEIKM